MTNRFCFLILATILSVTIAAGCSSATNPISLSGSDNIPIATMDELSDPFSTTGLLGAYSLAIDAETMTADLTPIRTSAIGESYLIEGIKYFTYSPCSTCLGITGVHLNPSGTIGISFNLQHPFEPGSLSENPSARNRRDLDIFDITAVIEPTSGAAPVSFLIAFETLYAGVVENADGYTLDLFDLIYNINALPFVLVIDESETDPIPNPKKWNKFGMGTDADFDIDFFLTTTKLQYNMYLTIGYGAAARKATFLQPKYYNPEFNKKAAWKVVVTPPEGDNPPDATNTWTSDDNATTKILRVEVYDWQIGAVQTLETDLENETDTSKVLELSEVASVRVEILGMTGAFVLATMPGTGAGMPGDPLVFEIPIANQNTLPSGVYPGMVTVVDGRQVGDPYIDTHDILIATDDGVTLSYHAIPAYQTQQFFWATVVDP